MGENERELGKVKILKPDLNEFRKDKYYLPRLYNPNKSMKFSKFDNFNLKELETAENPTFQRSMHEDEQNYFQLVIKVKPGADKTMAVS